MEKPPFRRLDGRRSRANYDAPATARQPPEINPAFTSFLRAAPSRPCALPCVMRPMNFTLRAATQDDADWLYELRRATMRDYVEQTFGVWDGQAQRRRFRQEAELAGIQIITCDQNAVGLLQVERGPAGLFLANLQIQPAFQNQGLGTAVIRALLAEAARAGSPLRLQVLKVNQRARELYGRLGFAAAGDTGTHLQMIWRPA